MFGKGISQPLVCAVLGFTLLGCATEEDLSPVQTPEARTNNGQEDIVRVEPRLEHCMDPELIAEQLTELINEFRSEPRDCGNGIRQAAEPLICDKRLENAAIVHSDDMANENFFSHTGSDGSAPGDRMDRQGYIWVEAIENLGPDHDRVSEVVEFWKNSDKGHCDNLMSDEVVDLGAACVYTDTADREYYWTLKLGKD